LDLSLGFDTRGLLDGHFVHGFYFGDRANVTTGDDIPEFGFGLELAVGLELNLGIVSFGVEGGVRGDLDFNWNDLDNNGKICFDELATLFELRPNPPTNPDIPGLCIFDVHGQLSAFLRFVYSILGIPGSVDIINQVFFSFDHHCSLFPPIDPAHVDDPNNTLVLSMGPNAGKRIEGTSTDVAETFSVKQTADGIEVTGQGAGEDQVTKTYTGADKIRGDGGLADDSITIDDSVKLPATLIGGAGNDTMQGGGGANTFVFFDDWGQDTITGSVSGTDVLDFSAVTRPLTIIQTANGWIIQDDQNPANKVTYTRSNPRKTLTGASPVASV